MGETVLRLEELRKSYGETVALDGVSFDVGAGQMFGFVGPNGAGKTTLMRIVLGVLEADSGRVLWQDAPIDADARRRIGYMPEERGLYPKMRVRDQLVYMAQLHGASEADAGAAADRWMERLGIEARADEAVEALSLGNQQRVQLGVALVHEPDLLVLDEPFSGLDPDGVDALSGALLTEISERQVPVVFSSHQLELVERLCDSVAIIAHGRIRAFGTLEEVGGGKPLGEVFRETTRSADEDDAKPGATASEPAADSDASEERP
jgi:ABC-2 type transport system ATP-binding protein